MQEDKLRLNDDVAEARRALTLSKYVHVFVCMSDSAAMGRATSREARVLSLQPKRLGPLVLLYQLLPISLQVCLWMWV
jgi:hypothetical protein